MYSEKKIKLFKRGPTQQIIFKKSLDRFLDDMTEIPNDITFNLNKIKIKIFI